jgi:hypothetical protein
MFNCPECGEKYDKLGNHWQYRPSHRPKITQKQLEIVKGLLMGDGCIYHKSKNAHLETDMTSINYLKYLNDVFGSLSNGVELHKTNGEAAKRDRNSGFNPKAKKENYSDLYRFKTRSHPKFNEFREWYSSGEKVWPEDIELTPTVLKHWYVGDGCHVNENQSSYIKISMMNESKNINKVIKYFSNSGLPKPSNHNIQENSCGVFWTVEDSYKLWDYMGEPLPDFEYKWPEDSVD